MARAASVSPAAIPPMARRAPWPTTSRTTAPRSAPSASLTPISRVRRATDAETVP